MSTNPPRQIRRHGFVASVTNPEKCALDACRLPYEAEVHWELITGTDVTPIEEKAYHVPVAEFFPAHKFVGEGPLCQFPKCNIDREHPIHNVV